MMKNFEIIEYHNSDTAINVDFELLEINYFYKYVGEPKYFEEIDVFSTLLRKIIESFKLRCYLVVSSLYKDTAAARKRKNSYGLKSEILSSYNKEYIINFHANYILRCKVIDLTDIDCYFECINYFFTGSHSISQSFLLTSPTSINITDTMMSSLFEAKLDRHENFTTYSPNFLNIFRLSQEEISCFFPFGGGFDLGRFTFLSNVEQLRQIPFDWLDTLLMPKNK